MAQRNRTKQTESLEARLTAEADRLRQAAENMPPGPEREDAIRKARQAEVGSHLSEWLRSPGLQSPR